MARKEMLVQTGYGTMFGLMLGAFLVDLTPNWCVPVISPARTALGAALVIGLGITVFLRAWRVGISPCL